jgi:hypothetical protein
MRPLLLSLIILSASARAGVAIAEPDGQVALENRQQWSPDHPIAIGGRVSSWVGDYFAPSLGGHLKLRPWAALGIEAFNDNFVMLQDQAWRHDHVIGFSAYAPSLITGTAWFLAPSAGMCVDFRFAHPTRSDAPSSSDILFGVHGGLMFELFVDYGFSFQANATVTGYLGHESGVSRWSATLSNELHVTPIGLITAGLNYYL